MKGTTSDHMLNIMQNDNPLYRTITATTCSTSYTIITATTCSTSYRTITATPVAVDALVRGVQRVIPRFNEERRRFHPHKV